MKLCFLADARAEHTRRWARYFALAGHQVDLITLNPDVLGGYEPVAVHVIAKPVAGSNLVARIRNGPRVLGELRALVRDLDPDVVHAHSLVPYVWLAWASRFRPYVATPWGTDILVHARASRWNFLLTAIALRAANLVVCDAEFLRAELERFGVAAARYRLIMFGVDVGRFRQPLAEEKAAVRDAFGLGGAPVVLSARTLYPVHDVETLIRAIPEVISACPNARFAIVGGGPERERLESLASQLGVDTAVLFVGRVEEDEMAQWLRAADVYVSTSLHDAGLSASTAEAMACGLPVVTTDNADNALWVENGVNGYRVPNGSVALLARQIIELLLDAEARERIGAANRAVIETRNNYSVEMGKMERLYGELAAERVR